MSRPVFVRAVGLIAAGLLLLAVSLREASAAGPAAGPAPAAAGTQPAEEPVEIVIAQAMDQRTTIELKDVPINDAVRRLSEQTGISIQMDAATVRFLPYGSQTLVTASIKDRPLRECLTALLQPVGLQFTVEKRRVLIDALPPLKRLARRATWPELARLEMLTNHAWSQELFDSLKFQFQDSSSDDVNVNRETLRKLAGAVGAGSAADVLEHATAQYGWTWYPAGEYIVILSRPKQIERQLERRVTLQYSEASLRDALLDLARQADVLLRLDPGVLATLPSPTVDHFSLTAENATVRQALELVAGQTGLSYFIEPDGIRITTAALPGSPGQGTVQTEATVQATVNAMRSNAFVGQITIPNKDGTSFSFVMRENDLPTEISELIKAKKQAAIGRIRQSLIATRPTE